MARVHAHVNVGRGAEQEERIVVLRWQRLRVGRIHIDDREHGHLGAVSTLSQWRSCAYLVVVGEGDACDNATKHADQQADTQKCTEGLSREIDRAIAKAKQDREAQQSHHL